MPTPIGAGYARVLHSMLLAGDAEPMAVTYGIQLEAGTGAAEDDAIVANLHAAFGSNAFGAVRGGYTLQSTKITFGGTDQTQLRQAFGGGPVADGGADALPQNSAYLIQKRSGIAGRRFQGRLYLPGVRELTVGNAGIIDSTWLASIQGFMNNWLTAIEASAGVIRMVILHSAPIGVLPLNPTPVTSLQVDRLIATQRQRLRR